MLIILCVTNDMATDQRVNRIATSLGKVMPNILVVGTVFPNSLTLPSSKYSTHRFRMTFKKGPLFYMEYNIRLFVYLLSSKATIMVSNDLDTLLAVYLASRLKQVPLVYDSHEYFTELPELVHRPLVRTIWKFLESIILPRVKYAYTVSSSIAQAYAEKYKLNMQVIRNVPYKKEWNIIDNSKIADKQKKRRENNRRIIYQGVLNMGRGLELAIRAMQYTQNARLIIAGAGYYENTLRDLVRALKLHDKVRFIGRVPPAKLSKYTKDADLGISLEENIGLNYYYALPNKLFDYIQAKIPVLVSNMPEMAAIVCKYDIGKITDTKDPLILAQLFTEMLHNQNHRILWRKNLEIAADELCWEIEENKLLYLYHTIIGDLNHRL
jgi:glycosyltransferase involved in cell wall biosynthesis